MILKDFLELLDADKDTIRIYSKEGKEKHGAALTSFEFNQYTKNKIVNDTMDRDNSLYSYLFCNICSISSNRSLSGEKSNITYFISIEFDEYARNRSMTKSELKWKYTNKPVMTVREFLKMIFPIYSNGTSVEIDLVNLSIFGMDPKNLEVEPYLISSVNKAIMNPATATMHPEAHYMLTFDDITKIISGESTMDDDYLESTVLFVSPIINKYPTSLGGNAAIALFITE